MADHHQAVFDAALKRLKPLFDSSEQAMYVYFDDAHKACNARYATILGYRDPAEWAAIRTNIPRAFVMDESLDTVIDSYQDAVGSGAAADVAVTWKKKDGKPVKTRTIFVPFDQDGHRMALHFVRPA